MLSDSSTRTKAELMDEIKRLRKRVDLFESSSSKGQHLMELLRDSERKSRAWLEYSPVCTKIVSLDLNLNYMSNAGVKALCIDDITPYYGKPYPFKFYPQSFRDKMTGNIERVKKTGEIVTQEAAVVDVNGNELWFHSTLVPIYGDDGQMDSISIVSIDITERTQAQEDLNQLNTKLEKQVANRTLALEEANLRLKELSETDALTKIPNRLVYERRLNEEIAYTRRTKQPLSLLMIDIDHFKQYNDNYGHDEGDIALKHVAKIIQSTLPRTTDLAARFGGEEFVALLPYTNSEGALEVAEKIRSKIQSTAIEHSYSDASSVLTVSIGISTHKDKEINEHEILQQADNALYKSKNKGRNRVEFFDNKENHSSKNQSRSHFK